MTISRSTGIIAENDNVFEDLGFSGEESVNLGIRAN